MKENINGKRNGKGKEYYIHNKYLMEYIYIIIKRKEKNI